MNNIFSPLSALSSIDPRSLKRLSSQVMVLIETKLWAKIIFAMLLGLCFGIVLSPEGPFPDFIVSYSKGIESLMSWLALPAKFFLRLIRMVIIPLILASIVLGLASATSMQQIKSLGLKFGIFVLVNTAIGATLGVFLATLIQPGKALSLAGASLSEIATKSQELKFSADTLIEILPLNPLASIVGGEMLDVVIIAIISGIAVLTLHKEQAKTVLDLLEVVQTVSMNIISWAMRLAPYAVFGMMTQVAQTSGIKALQSMSMYLATVMFGFFVFIAFYIIIVMIVKKESPKKYFKSLATPMLLAFSTSSSAATMPVSMKVAEEEMGVSPSVARFLIPLGTTINMAGSAIWQTTAVIFISQVYGIQLSLGQISFIVVTSVGSSIGSPGVPGVGMGILATILAKIGIPIEGVSLIMGVNRLVDMSCTVVNVAGDLTAAKLFGGKSA